MAKQPARRKVGVAKRATAAKKRTATKEKADKLERLGKSQEWAGKGTYGRPSKSVAAKGAAKVSKAMKLRGKGKSTGGRSK